MQTAASFASGLELTSGCFSVGAIINECRTRNRPLSPLALEEAVGGASSHRPS